MSRKKTSLSYESALEELQQIVTALQEEKVDMDALSKQVKRAAELVQFCKEKLRQTETEVDELLGE